MLKGGDIVWMDFPGAVVTKRRPAVVLSSAQYHTARPDVIVGLLTSQVAKATAVTDHVLRDWSGAGLRVPSAFRAFLVTVPQSAIVQQVGYLSDPDWQTVRNCVRTALDVV